MRVMEQLPSNEYRLIFALARFAGLRTPSESPALTWADVDFEQRKLYRHDRTRQRFAGQAKRTMPILPELMNAIQARIDEVGEGEQYLVTKRGGNLRLVMERAARRAGVDQWDDLFQGLRSSCEKQAQYGAVLGGITGTDPVNKKPPFTLKR